MNKHEKTEKTKGALAGVMDVIAFEQYEDQGTLDKELF